MEALTHGIFSNRFLSMSWVEHNWLLCQGVAGEYIQKHTELICSKDPNTLYNVYRKNENDGEPISASEKIQRGVVNALEDG